LTPPFSSLTFPSCSWLSPAFFQKSALPYILPPPTTGPQGRVVNRQVPTLNSPDTSPSYFLSLPPRTNVSALRGRPTLFQAMTRLLSVVLPGPPCLFFPVEAVFSSRCCCFSQLLPNMRDLPPCFSLLGCNSLPHQPSFASAPRGPHL